jgi:hypothetical protein
MRGLVVDTPEQRPRVKRNFLSGQKKSGARLTISQLIELVAQLVIFQAKLGTSCRLPRKRLQIKRNKKDHARVDSLCLIPRQPRKLEGRQDVAIEYRGEKFAGYNKPKRTPGAKKSHAVLAKTGSQVKLIRFGQQGVQGSPKKAGESDSYRKRRESFKARHAKNIAKGKMSAAYWADKVKW